MPPFYNIMLIGALHVLSTEQDVIQLFLTSGKTSLEIETGLIRIYQMHKEIANSFLVINNISKSREFGMKAIAVNLLLVTHDDIESHNIIVNYYRINATLIRES